jgi:hypothetical protein
MRNYRTSADGLANGPFDPLLPILFVTRYGRNAHYPHMSGRSVEQAGRGAGICAYARIEQRLRGKVDASS